ncbi:MAG: hypothetical protein ABI588_00785 [Arenimonas sp.]
MVRVCEVPEPSFSLAAFCRADFDAILQRTGSTPEVSDVKSFKEKIDTVRAIFLELSDQRYASLTKRDSQNEFEIGLQRTGWLFYEHELKAVAEFIKVDYNEIERYCNPPIKWIPDNPA